MKIVAVCKTYSGPEFVGVMIESIYDHVDRILFLHSNIPWDGASGAGNAVAPVISKWKAENDVQGKIVEARHDTNSQDEQYQAAIDTLSDMGIIYDYLLLIDTDEVWSRKNIERLIQCAKDNPGKPAYNVEMDTFIKSPLYKIFPREGCRPTVLVRAGEKIDGPRGSDIPGKLFLAGPIMHHFTGVRLSLSDVIMKIKSTNHIEDVAHHDIQTWISKTWNSPSTATNCHWTIGAERSWQRLVKVDKSELPETMQNHPIALAFERYKFRDEPKPATSADAQQKGHKVKTLKFKNQLSIRNAGDLKRSEIERAAAKAKIQKKPEQPAAEHYEGSLAIMTVVDSGYAPFIPMWAKWIRDCIPGSQTVVFVRGNGQIAGNVYGAKVIPITNDDYPQGGYTTAAMRFLIGTDVIAGHDYTLITDADIMFFMENVTVIDQHVRIMERDGTKCYENWITEDRGFGCPRMPGVHFVTKEWATLSAGSVLDEIESLKKTGATEYCYDEYMIGRIVVNSGLPLPPRRGAKLWRHHGVHIGDWRMSVERKRNPRSPDVFEKIAIRSMLDDAEFMGLAEEASKSILYLPGVIKAWKQALL